MLSKNDIIELEIIDITAEGMGVGRYDGMAVFVPMSAVGDQLSVRIVKMQKTLCYGIVQDILSPSPTRIKPDCPVYSRCGGCSLRHIRYDEECRLKNHIVAENLRRIGGVALELPPLLPSPAECHYRNKAQYPFTQTEDGARGGFYASRSHRVIPYSGCALQPEIFGEILRFVEEFIDRYHIPVYDEENHRGLIRHLYLRRGEVSGEILLCLVINGAELPHCGQFVSSVTARFPAIASIVLNLNRERTNVILGRKNRLLYGKENISDTLCGVRFELSPMAFYQVNHDAAEQLYRTAGEFAQLQPEDVLLDLYCGAGTIGLSMAGQVKELIGVEIVREAVENAAQNAKKNGIANARFLCGDAAEAAGILAGEGIRPNVVIIDPPRKGCDPALLATIAGMAPDRLVYISCNSATLARDIALLAEHGYQAVRCQAVDLFPRTAHVETVVLLSKLNTKQHIEVELNLDELDLTSAESKATYDEIKAYVLEKHGLKVSSLYISQVKRKCGLDVGQNYNLSKKEDAKVPQCPPEKEAAIMDALKHFQMI